MERDAKAALKEQAIEEFKLSSKPRQPDRRPKKGQGSSCPFLM